MKEAISTPSCGGRAPRSSVRAASRGEEVTLPEAALSNARRPERVNR